MIVLWSIGGYATHAVEDFVADLLCGRFAEQGGLQTVRSRGGAAAPVVFSQDCGTEHLFFSVGFGGS